MDSSTEQGTIDRPDFSQPQPTRQICVLTETPLIDNMVKIRVLGTHFHALIDTGAGVSAISQDTFCKLQKIRSINVDKSKTSHIQLADGSLVKTQGNVTLQIKIDQGTYEENFCILPELGQDIILGMPFLTKYSAKLNFSQKCMILPSEFPAKSMSKIVIPPRAEISFMAHLGQVHVPNGIHGDTKTHRQFINKNGMLTAKLAVSVKDNQIPVKVLNHTDRPRTIKQGARVATFTPWHADTVIKELPPPATPQDPQTGQGDTARPQGPKQTSSSLSDVDKVDKAASSASLDPQQQRHLENILSTVDISDSMLTTVEKSKVSSLIREFPDVFANNETGELGHCTVKKHHIELVENAKPVRKLPYRCSPDKRREIDRQCENLVRQGIIRTTDTGDWSSPCLLVQKSDGTYRLVVDFRHLNKVTVPQVLRIPRIDCTLDSVAEQKPKYFTKLDLDQAYYQMALDDESKGLTGFITHRQKYVFERLPMGIANAPASFQNLIDVISASIRFEFLQSYLDDLIIFSADLDGH